MRKSLSSDIVKKILVIVVFSISAALLMRIQIGGMPNFSFGANNQDNLKLKATKEKIINLEIVSDISTTTKIVNYRYFGKKIRNKDKYGGKDEIISKRGKNYQVFDGGKTVGGEEKNIIRYYNVPFDVFGGEGNLTEVELATTTEENFNKQTIETSFIKSLFGKTANAITATTAPNKATYLFASNPTTAFSDGISRYVGAIGGALTSPFSFTMPNLSGNISQITYFAYSAERGGASFAVNLHHQTHADWVQAEATWNQYKSGSNWTTAGGDYDATIVDTSNCPAVGNWQSWDLLGGTSDNPITLTWGQSWDGLLRSSITSGTQYVGYRPATPDLFPYIEITYTVNDTKKSNIINFN